MRFLPRRWNDTLSIFVIVGVPLLWVFGHLPEIVLGATITGWSMVITFYFRKAPADSTGELPHG